MAWKKVAPDFVLVTLKPIEGRKSIVLKEGDGVEGYFLGVKEDEKVRNGFAFFQTEDGQLLKMINYPGVAWKLKSVKPGIMTRVEYKGKRKNRNGRDFHDFEVYIDEDRVLGSEEQREILESIALQSMEGEADAGIEDIEL